MCLSLSALFQIAALVFIVSSVLLTLHLIVLLVSQDRSLGYDFYFILLPCNALSAVFSLNTALSAALTF